MSRASNISLIFLFVLTILVNFSNLIGLLGSGGLIAILLLVLVSLAVGYFAGGPDAGIRRVLGLGTAQRNLPAGFVVAGSFPEPNVITLVAAAGAIMLVILMWAASCRRLRARQWHPTRTRDRQLQRPALQRGRIRRLSHLLGGAGSGGGRSWHAECS